MKLLDLFCGAGGAARGYADAGFEVVGVDIAPQPHFPFEFIRVDWESAIATIPDAWERAGEKYAVHASPPCQHYSTMTKKWGRSGNHPDLIDDVRQALLALNDKDGDVPFVIENVVGAPLLAPIMLCGSMFGLKSGDYQLRRHRLFESNVFFLSPGQCHHKGLALPVYGHAGGRSKRDGLKSPGTAAWREGMGIDWMTGKELAEAIPPAFTRFIGERLKAAMEGK